VSAQKRVGHASRLKVRFTVRVATLDDGLRTSGVHSVTWDGRDESGHDVAAGIYFARLSWNGAPRATERVTVVR
jgi:flagellar hook assembly protein FlgD